MKSTLAIGGLAGLLIFGARAEEGPDLNRTSPAVEVPLDWSEFGVVFGGAPARTGEASTPADSLDVVDAHWMALTMWGEARGDGEEGMRAVGHVIDNRRKAGRHGRYVTEAVSEAYQFSCWNAGDPNREAMLHIDALPRDSRDYQLWQTARRLADEILAGRSEDPTAGALFYHAANVAPAWSDGIPPIRRVGRHLFFHAAR